MTNIVRRTTVFVILLAVFSLTYTKKVAVEAEKICGQVVSQCESAYKKTEKGGEFCDMLKRRIAECRAEVSSNTTCFSECVNDCSARVSSAKKWQQCSASCRHCALGRSRGYYSAAEVCNAFVEECFYIARRVPDVYGMCVNFRNQLSRCYQVVQTNPNCYAQYASRCGEIAYSYNFMAWKQCVDSSAACYTGGGYGGGFGYKKK